MPSTSTRNTGSLRLRAQPSRRHNLDGKDNYVFCETRGRGHLMGVTLGVVQNADGWMGEGDEMIFIDDENMPVINGTGTEDYSGSWIRRARRPACPLPTASMRAAHRLPERTGGRYCCYAGTATTR